MVFHIIISGKVTGVFFRDFTVKTARSLGIRGWVRNLEDKKVEIKAQCERDQLKKFVEKLKQGPPAAEVADIVIEEEKLDKEFESFNRI